MKTYFMKCLGFTALLLTAQVLTGCNTDDEAPMEPDKPSDQKCYVQLYDGDNFEDDNITVNGPGEFSNLKNLPGAKMDWSDEADALKVGPKSTLTIWAKEDFKGDSTVYKPGTEVPSLDNEPQSMKITCED